MCLEGGREMLKLARVGPQIRSCIRSPSGRRNPSQDLEHCCACFTRESLPLVACSEAKISDVLGRSSTPPIHGGEG